jgi:hypothetical protein
MNRQRIMLETFDAVKSGVETDVKPDSTSKHKFLHALFAGTRNRYGTNLGWQHQAPAVFPGVRSYAKTSTLDLNSDKLR